MTSISIKHGREILACVTENYLRQYGQEDTTSREPLDLFGAARAGKEQHTK